MKILFVLFLINTSLFCQEREYKGGATYTFTLGRLKEETTKIDADEIINVDVDEIVWKEGIRVEKISPVSCNKDIWKNVKGNLHIKVVIPKGVKRCEVTIKVPGKTDPHTSADLIF